MKTSIILIVFLLLFGCSESDIEEDPAVNYKGPFAFYLEHDVLCAGQSSTFHAVMLDTWKEVPISELLFNPLNPSDGVISERGIYTAPSNLTESRTIWLQAKFKHGSKESINGSIKVSPSGSFPSTWVKTINEQLGFGRPFGVMENGDLIFGSSNLMMDATEESTHEILRITPDGRLIWRKNLGNGKSTQLNVNGDKIYSIDHFNKNHLTILDTDGNIITEISIPYEANVNLISLDEEGNLYLLINSDQGSTIVKMNETGTFLSEVQTPYIIQQLSIDKNNITGSGRKPENSDYILFLLDSNWKEIWVVNVDPQTALGPVFSKWFLMPSGKIGQPSYVPFEGIWKVDFYSFDGSKDFPPLILNRSTLGVNQSSKEKNSKDKRLAFIDCLLAARNGEVYFGGFSYNDQFLFLEVVSLSGKQWMWWEKRPDSFAIGFEISIVSFSEVEDGLILIADLGTEVISFKLDYELNLDPCLYKPLWRSN